MPANNVALLLTSHPRRGGVLSAAAEPAPTVNRVKVAFGLAADTVVGLTWQVSPVTPDWGVQVRLTVPVNAKIEFRPRAAVPWPPGAAMLTLLGFTKMEKSTGQAFTTTLASSEPRPVVRSYPLSAE